MSPDPANSPVFPSRVDGWLVAVLLLAVVSPLGAAVWGGTDLVLAITTVFATMLVCVVLLVPCRYTLAGDHLLIRCGLIHQRIAYGDMTAVEPSRSLWSAPALSLRRVKISYKRMSSQLVSPRDREVFIKALRERVQAAHTAVQ